MVNYLIDMECRVIPTENGYDVKYENGEFRGVVNYVRYSMDNIVMRGKPVYLMVNSDMGDVIEYINSTRGLTSEDLTKLQMEIRTHSREMIDEFIIRMGKGI